MIISIQQPEHWPWLGFFDKIRLVDEVVLLDNVQFKPRYFESRQKIRTPNGWQWIRIPVIGSRHRQLIKDVKIDNSKPWQKDAFEAIKLNYERSPYWKKYSPDIYKIYEKKWENLVDFNIEVIKWLAEGLNLKKKFHLASKLKTKKKADDLLIEICKKIKADAYLSGRDGRNYIDQTKFEKAKIKLFFQDFSHPEYKQFQKGKFEQAMSTLDLLFNYGKTAVKILTV